METKLQSNNTPSILVVFGATGDLAAKKIFPSLWHLFRQKRLPGRLSVLGFSRRTMSDGEFQILVREAVLAHGGNKAGEKELAGFLGLFSYQAGIFEDEGAFRSLSGRIAETEKSWGVCANKLFYLAVPPASFKTIFNNLAAVKLNVPCGGDLGWSRVLVEKPFGADRQSAKGLQSLLASHFREEQIYRIDHYLFKEIVQGIKTFRFSNNLFENAWDNTTVERIDIRLLESIGVEDRGGFYDSVGAFRDVGQNHLLTMLATLTMEYPGGTDVDAVRESRTNILSALAPWTDESVRKNTYRAQYRGYRNIKGVAPGSKTETYFALVTELLRPRWRGVPITMEAGKRAGAARKEIVLTLKHPSVCLLCETAKPHAPNRIVFRLEPNDEIVIHFLTKKPGFEQVLEERAFSFFLYEKETKEQYVEEYAKVLHAAVEGDRALFISPEEVEASWKFADPVVDGWKRNLVPLAEYEPDVAPAPAILGLRRDAQEEKKSGAGGLGVIGLGKMGANLARRARSKGWKVAGFNRSPAATKELESEGVGGAYSLRELVQKLSAPRTIWLMVPYRAVDSVLGELVPLLGKGDTVIDGGNSPYKESIRRNKELKDRDIHFLDIGVSGGPAGALNGACLMVGGEKKLYERYERLFKDLSVENGYGYMGKSGAGHFVKMVHNGIEYGMMQSIGEGFEIMKDSSFSLGLRSVAEVYNHGSVISSRLVGWLAEAYAKFGDDLNADECCSGKVAQSGEGQWTVDAAHELGVPAAIIEGALEFRKQSQEKPSYTGQVVSALRHEFGGHDASNKDKEK